MPQIDVQQIFRDLPDHRFAVHQTLVLREPDISTDERIVRDIALTSDDPIFHYFPTGGAIYLILDHGKSSIDLARMKSDGPALWSHDPAMHVGRWLNPRIDRGKVRADCKFSRSVLGEEKFRDVQDDILVSISAGFFILDLTPEMDGKSGEQREINGIPVFRCFKSMLFESSFLTTPADTAVGVGRSLQQPQPEQILGATERNSTNEEKIMADKLENQPDPKEAPGVETRTAADIAADNRLLAAKRVAEWGGVLGAQSELVTEYIRTLPTAETPTEEGLRAYLLANEKPSTKIPAADPAAIAERNGQPAQLAVSMPRHSAITAFDRGSKQENALAAYRLGAWALSTIFRGYAKDARGNPTNGGIFEKATRFSIENGLVDPSLIRAMSEGVNAKGGFLVPEEFGNDMIDLVLAYGVFRRNANVVQMSSDVRSDPRFVSGPTVYFTGESQQITESDLVVDRVNLEAKKLAALVVYSSELDEDSVVDIGNLVADKAARAFAKREDECGFLGDGTSYYGGMFGVLPKILGLDGTIANIAGVKVGAGNLYSELTLQDFLDTMGLMPDFEGASADRMKWYVNKGFYFNVMARLMLAGGGITSADVTDRLEQRFLGYPVEFVNVFPNTAANSQIVGVFGDLKAAATMGVRREFTLAESTEVRFIYDDIVAKATERFGINVHSVGNASATAADRVAGPLTALITAAS